PELRASAQDRKAQAAEVEARAPVRPAEQVSDQPATYDRLPPPRQLDNAPPPEASDITQSAGHTPTAATRSAPRTYEAATSRQADAQSLAIRSDLFFEQPTHRAERVRATATVATSQTRPLSAHQQTQSSGQGLSSSVYNQNALQTPASPYEIKAGAIIPAALLTGVDTSRPGPVVAVVSANVFDTVTGSHLLVPQGARLIGQHDGGSAYGDRRAFLEWRRLILPNGKSLELDGEPGVDAAGATGVEGRVDRRLGALMTGTLFAGAITTLGQAARDGDDRGSFLGDAGDAAAIEGARVGGRLIDRELEVRPAIKVEAGAQGWTALALVTAVVIAPVIVALSEHAPRLALVNETTSLPRGVYVRVGQRAPQAGAITAVRQPLGARRYLGALGVPEDMLLLKRVVATGGEHVCSEADHIRYPGGQVSVLERDSRGDVLPRWQECRVLGDDEVFLLGDSATSFDSRYFGPVQRQQLLGAYQAVLTCAQQASAQAVNWGRAGGDLFGANALEVAPTRIAPPAEVRLTGTPFAEVIALAAQTHGVDPRLLTALVLSESAFRPDAVSAAGAVGLTQLMPGTARDLGVHDRLDPTENLMGGAAYLAAQIRTFGDLRLALAAYNSGPGRVAAAGGVPPIRETQAYVLQVIECYLAMLAGRDVRSRRDCELQRGAR
ncbi:hypothetical protein LTR94_025283, partial [Friedmanniomyces endolithicus]